MKDDDRKGCGDYRGDVVPLTPPDARGLGLAVQHLPGGEHQTVLVQAVRDGAPAPPGGERAVDMGDGSFASKRFLAGGAGPAQVATPVYRTNYDTIFGKRQEAGQA